jgi:GNAT superfamily N-acetyltransferase
MNGGCAVTSAVVESSATGITFRALSSADAEAYKELRTKAVTEQDRRYFYVDPEKELAQDWRAVCAETCDKALFGAFDGNRLVGAMASTLWERDATGKTAYYRAAYVLPEFRHTFVTKALINMIDNWAIKHHCDKAVYAIREDNKNWIEKQIKNGAAIIGDEPMRFADGSTAKTYWLQRRFG